MRVDKWLWHARFFKTRGLATKLVTAGHVRVNGDKIAKSSYGITEGDVLTFPQAKQVRVIRILALSTRRGPAPEAQALYEDLDPPAQKTDNVPQSQASAPKTVGKGRPTKKDRRILDQTRRTMLD
ncbi:RNA-binding S4 domain-containing protein [Aliiroseovarius sp. PrR006]|uniref:RNA-binding S4 domain-containing protein n=1 Tax=Aliiroseovarius sp. PrR006 TaxID=2706883 RepID=UPI001EF2274D|nr:RNA-binding S4 domain-containing protein [Aliiroseovarius sp. PrR006]